MKICCLVIVVLFGLIATPVMAQDEPVIAPEIANLIGAGNRAGAQVRYEELVQTDGLDMAKEVQGLQTLLAAYMQAGKQEDAQVVANMSADLTQKMMSSLMNQHSPQMAEQMEAAQEAQRQAKRQQQADQQAERDLEQQRQAQARGKNRDDLDRFTGMYSAPGGDESRAIFVTVSCDGYLVTGPMWADVGPWWMRSAADSVFTYSDSFLAFSMEFRADSDSTSMKHDLEGINSPMVRVGGLPEGWQDCVERTLR